MQHLDRSPGSSTTPAGVVKVVPIRAGSLRQPGRVAVTIFIGKMSRECSSLRPSMQGSRLAVR